MSEVSSGRRRLGILAITTTALALPLTASITYAQSEPEADEQPIETIDPGESRHEVRVERIMHEGDEADAAEHERRVIRIVRNGEVEESADGERRMIRRRIHPDGEEMSEAEIDAMMAELEQELEGLDGTIEMAIEMAMAAREEAMEGMERHRIVMSDREAGLHSLEINCSGDDPVVEQQLADGRRAMVICRAAIRAEAAEGLREARDEIANDPDIPEHLREEILRSLDRSLERMSADDRRDVHRAQAKLDARTAPAAAPRAASVAMRWQGRMVSPIRVQAVAPVRVVPAAPAILPVPSVQADCEDSVVRA